MAEMLYRKVARTGDEVGVIGMGTSSNGEAGAEDALASEHYAGLAVKADACTGCGHCNDTCLFHVGQVARMAEIRGYFGQ